MDCNESNDIGKLPEKNWFLSGFSFSETLLRAENHKPIECQKNKHSNNPLKQQERALHYTVEYTSIDNYSNATVDAKTF